MKSNVEMQEKPQIFQNYWSLNDMNYVHFEPKECYLVNR